MTNIDGIYAIKMTGSDGQGFGMFVFLGGKITGVDPLGVQFDGIYSGADDGKAFEAKVTVKVPPEGLVIQGVSAGKAGLTYDVLLHLPIDFVDRDYLKVDTPLGPVNAKFLRLRSLSADNENV